MSSHGGQWHAFMRCRTGRWRCRWGEVASDSWSWARIGRCGWDISAAPHTDAILPLAELPVIADDIEHGDYVPDGSAFAVAGADGQIKIYRDTFASGLESMFRDACQRLRYQPQLAEVRDVCR